MTSRPDDGDDPRLAEALRRALARSAAEVHPVGDGLTKIRARTARARRQRWLVPVAAATTAIVVTGGIAWAAGTLGSRDETPPVAGTTVPVTSGPVTTTDTTVGTETPTPAPEATIPVYYLGAQPSESGIPLYKVFREYRRLPAEDVTDRAERVRVALTEMFENAPLDDDYFGLWPLSATVLDTSVDLDSGVVTVDVNGLEWTNVRTPDGRLVPEVGGALVQQLVYTATAAASKITSEDEFSATGGVQLLVDGAPVDSVLGVETDNPVKRDPGGYQAIIWITDPELGETVGDPVTVRLVANLYEGGPAQWELRRDGEVVDSGPAGELGEQGVWLPYEFTIEDIEAGAYELEVFDVGGSGLREIAPFDSKTFTVQ